MNDIQIKMHNDNLKAYKYYDEKHYIKDRFNKYNKYTMLYYVSHKKSTEKGFKSFLNFIKPYIKENNFIDFYNRFKPYDFYNGLNKTFNKSNGVFKVWLSDIDLEKINKKYLFFKNNLTLDNNINISIIRYDEFLKNIPYKKNWDIYNELEKGFYNGYNKYKALLNSFIIIVEFLSYDEKYNYIYCNKLVKNDLLQLIKINPIKWDKTSNNKLLKSIKNNRYKNLNNNDKKEYLLKQLKNTEKLFKNKSEKLDFIKKEMLLECKNKDKTKYNKLKNKFNKLLSDYNDLQNDMIDLNNYLIDLDKKSDEFLSNVTEKINYSLKLKSYL